MPKTMKRCFTCHADVPRKVATALAVVRATIFHGQCPPTLVFDEAAESLWQLADDGFRSVLDPDGEYSGDRGAARGFPKMYLHEHELVACPDCFGHAVARALGQASTHARRQGGEHA